MTPSAIATLLNTADNISRIKFSVTKYENKDAALHCLLLSTPGLSKDEINTLALELDSAIAPIVKRWSDSLMTIAANQLRSHL